jgi:hypothetical protein
MVSSGMLRRVALVRTYVSEELIASFMRLTRIGELGKTLAVSSVFLSSQILVSVMKEALSSSETSILPRATRRNIQEDAIRHSHPVKTSNLTNRNQTRKWYVPPKRLLYFN